VSELLWHDTQPVFRRNAASARWSSGRLRVIAARAEAAGAGIGAAGAASAMSLAPALSNRSTIGVGPRLRAIARAVMPPGPTACGSTPRSRSARISSGVVASDAAATISMLTPGMNG
jgi:hypothetical protein